MISERIKELRKNKGLTQIEFAKQFNISCGTIAMWETGKRTPGIETIKKIAEFFGVSVDYLTGSNITLDYSYIDETKEYCKKYFPKHSEKIEHLMLDIDNLTDKGVDEACKRVHELTLIPEYSNEDRDYK